MNIDGSFNRVSLAERKQDALLAFYNASEHLFEARTKIFSQVIGLDIDPVAKTVLPRFTEEQKKTLKLLDEQISFLKKKYLGA